MRSLLLAAPLLLAGCLPGSQREIDRSLSAADSASVALAASVPVDTMAVVATAEPPASTPFQLATSLAWVEPDTPRARLAVVDTQAEVLWWFSADGHPERPWRIPETSPFPYLAGVRGDTVVVLSRNDGGLAWLAPGRALRQMPTPPGATAALVTDSLIVVRLGGGPIAADTLAPTLVRLSASGRVVARHPIQAPVWRAAGFIRLWDGDLVSLAGYRPVVDRVPLGAPEGTPTDTLALSGFTSPQLARSAQFLRGEVSTPPLLTSSAVALGRRLLVLNLRADGVRVDVYGPDGQIERVLVGPEPPAPLDVVAVDLAVRRVSGGVEIAVLMARPGGLLQASGGRVVVYRWVTPEA